MDKDIVLIQPSLVKLIAQRVINVLVILIAQVTTQIAQVYSLKIVAPVMKKNMLGNVLRVWQVVEVALMLLIVAVPVLNA